MAPKNVSSWRLNKAETAELEQRVAAGEDESKVKRELQEKKAQANEDRKQMKTARLRPKRSRKNVSCRHKP